MSERTLRARVAQEVAEVIASRRVGAYQHLSLVAPGVAELARPGQFVALAVGGETSGTLLRRSFSIHEVSPSGTYGGTAVRCEQLRGDIGVDAHCGVYALRPSPCHALKPAWEDGTASPQCDKARVAHGMEPLTPQVWEHEVAIG